MSSSTPISVLMAFHNDLPYLPAAVESILSQTYSDYEFILIDDHSTDGSLQYAESLKDKRIRLFSSPGRGLTSALNYGLERAQGEWIARMDADDWSYPTRLSRQIAATKDPNTILVSSDYAVCDENLDPVAEIHLCPPNEKLFEYLRKKNNPFCHPVMMFHRQKAINAGGYRFERAQDYDLWIRLLELGQLQHVEESLLKYRVRRSGISIRHVNEQTASREAIQKQRGPERVLKSKGTSNGQYAYRLGFAEWVAGRRGPASRHLMASLLQGNNIIRSLCALILMVFPRSRYLSLAGYTGVYKF